MRSGIRPQKTEPLTGDVMVSPTATRKVTRPGSSNPMTSGRQPTVRSRTSGRIASTTSHSATAANDSRRATSSAGGISSNTYLLAGVADDHRKTAASMASVGSDDKGEYRFPERDSHGSMGLRRLW